MRVLTRFPRTLLLLVVLLVFVPSGTAVASQTYADTAGDAPAGAPDMTGVTVSNTFGGKITFNVAFANRGTLAGDDMVLVAIDRDQNRLDRAGGMDYAVVVVGEMPSLAVVLPLSGSGAVVTVPVTWSNNAMSFTIDKSQIGSPTAGIDFVLASTGAGSADDPPMENVPHSGFLEYSLQVSISQIQLTNTATTVKAGSLLSVRGATVKLSTDEVFSPDTLTAKATIAGKAVKPAAGGLAWKIPKTIKGKKTVGKKLVVTMNASYQGMNAKQTLTLRIVK